MTNEIGKEPNFFDRGMLPSDEQGTLWRDPVGRANFYFATDPHHPEIPSSHEAYEQSEFDTAREVGAVALQVHLEV